MTNEQLFITCGVEPFKWGFHFYIFISSLHLDEKDSNLIQRSQSGPFGIWVDDNSRRAMPLNRSLPTMIALASRKFQHATILFAGPKNRRTPNVASGRVAAYF